MPRFNESQAKNVIAAAAASDDNAILGCHLFAEAMQFGRCMLDRKLSLEVDQTQLSVLTHSEEGGCLPPLLSLLCMPDFKQLKSDCSGFRLALAHAPERWDVGDVTRDVCLRLSSSGDVHEELYEIFTSPSPVKDVKLLRAAAIEEDHELCSELAWSMKVCPPWADDSINYTHA